MRTVQTSKITQAVKEMCMEVNIKLSDDVKEAILEAKDRQKAGKTLAAQGLFLMNVNYEEKKV